MSVLVSHCVSLAVGRGAFAPSDTESQALVVTDQAGRQTLPRPTGAALQVKGKATAPSLPWKVVILWSEWRGCDGVFWFHHPLPEHCH